MTKQLNYTTKILKDRKLIQFVTKQPKRKSFTIVLAIQPSTSFLLLLLTFTISTRLLLNSSCNNICPCSNIHFKLWQTICRSLCKPWLCRCLCRWLCNCLWSCEVSCAVACANAFVDVYADGYVDAHEVGCALVDGLTLADSLYPLQDLWLWPFSPHFK